MILFNETDVVFRNHLVSKTPHLLILGLTEQNSTNSTKDNLLSLRFIAVLSRFIFDLENRSFFSKAKMKLKSRLVAFPCQSMSEEVSNFDQKLLFFRKNSNLDS